MNSPTAKLPKKNWIWIGLTVAVLLAAAWLLWPGEDENGNTTNAISNFEECVTAGYPVMESHPRQCRAENGELFVEELEDEIGAAYEDYVSEGGEIVRVQYPLSGDEAHSPLQIAGEVRGSWSFEGDFPVELQDENGETIAEGVAQLRGDWMTESYVPFEALLEFDPEGAGASVLLVLHKDNPSDNRELDDKIEIPLNLR